MRLVGGAAPYEGRLEVRYDGQWGTVCDDGFTDREATVFCQMLKYRFVASYGHKNIQSPKHIKMF